MLQFNKPPFMAIFTKSTEHDLHDDNEPIQFPNKPVQVPLRTGNPRNPPLASLKFLVESRVKSLSTPFTPLWWLPNGHLQTLYTVFGDFSKTEQMSYFRRLLRLSDGGTLGLDFAPANDAHIPDDAPIIVVKHGLTGGSHEPYVRAILSRACAPIEQGGLGYRAVVCNFRGCAGTPITAPQFYSAGRTDDLHQALMYIHYRYPKAPLIGLGFSLGANVMTRYLGQEGEKSRLVSGCTLGCPWDMVNNGDHLNETFLGRNLYSKAMGRNLQNLVNVHQLALRSNPDLVMAQITDQVLALKQPTVDEFNEVFGRMLFGSHHNLPFKSTHDYYQSSSSHISLSGIRVPYLAINAKDDPVVRHVPLDGAGNGWVTMKLTKRGGHLGWFQAGPGIVDRWTTKPVLEWFKMTAQEIDVSRGRTYPKLWIDEDGFIREEGRPDLACKIVPGGGIVDGKSNESGVLQGL